MDKIMRSIEVHIHGIVQGVGFRPFVYRLAARFSLVGSICNTSTGVLIRAGGNPARLDSFIAALEQEAPPLAVITFFSWSPLPEPLKEDNFVILKSEAQKRPATLISPDITVCEDCLAEITDPADRRYGYPFTNCTNCGPRFTIISGLPYDRPKTSMNIFSMCEACRLEYEDPLDRRFHAQPNACPVCGPKLSLHDDKQLFADDHSIGETARALQNGLIVAVKGLGGFHLCVDATSEEAVNRLRKRKHRYAKPLAVMVADIAVAHKFGYLSTDEEALLQCRQHPIVLVKKRAQSGLARDISPGINEIGIMLPYTPLHSLLVAHAATPEVLVMTSGNLSDEPICTSNQDALTRLAGIADLFLVHNRDIVTRVDDSVVRWLNGRLQMIRRSRGYAPMPVLLANELPELLACGAELKNTFCLARGKMSFPGQHIGDLTGPKNLLFYEESITHFQDVFKIQPTRVVCDLHPDYLSTSFARKYSAARFLPLVQVQHHHAHAAAVMAEHDLDEVLAVVFDGSGFGADGTVWGGEFLHASRSQCSRFGHIGQFSLPGGDAAIREPWRIGLSLLLHTSARIDSPALADFFKIPVSSLSLLLQMLERNINSPLTSSCGRLFDGVAALLGVRSHVQYEGQAAMELECLAWSADEDPASVSTNFCPQYGPYLEEKKRIWQVKIRPIIEALVTERDSGVAREQSAWNFHCRLAVSACEVVKQGAIQTGLTTVVLAGGCMQNRLLVTLLYNLLEREGLAVYSGEKIPVNDGGISLGQAYIGGVHDVSGNSHAGA
jgi:hydrogenase maturation protein HypF